MPKKLNQSGQLILALILVMMVGLGIGLSVVQKSLVDVSTASKVEQSSRAFSAAEAGIEKYLQSGLSSISCTKETCGVKFSENNSEAKVEGGNLIPAYPPTSTRQEPLEFPPLAKEDIAHVWLADYTSLSNPPAAVYTQNTLDIYWGNSTADKAALELTLVYYNGSQYLSRKWYLDQEARTPLNNFELANCAGNFPPPMEAYQCKKTIGATPDAALPAGLMLIRARLLYAASSQPFAVWANGVCGSACSLPPQARVLISTGSSGETQRRVKLFQIDKVAPPYFDYAIFSAGDIRK